MELQDTNKEAEEAVNYSELPPPPDGGKCFEDATKLIYDNAINFF